MKIKAAIKNDADDTKELVKGPYETKMPINLDREDKYKYPIKFYWIIVLLYNQAKYYIK